MRIVKLRTKHEQNILLGCAVLNMDTIDEIKSYRAYVAEATSILAKGNDVKLGKDKRSVEEFIQDIHKEHQIGEPMDKNIKPKIKQGKEHTIEVKNNNDYIIIQRN